ncbi:MAG: GH25 family lysozyme [Anaerococcus sp.]|nr:GH25 family lysozyme [Anaerococcus sp.]
MKVKKIIPVLVSIGILMPSFAYADDDVISYDIDDLDQVYQEMGFDYDRDQVLSRKKDHLLKDVLKEDSDKGQEDINSSGIDASKPSNDQKPEDLEDPSIKEEDEDLKPKVYENVVDLSHYQNPGSIDYDNFSSGIDGAILRTSIREKDLTISKDKAVDTHYNQLNKRDVPIGFYHYSRAINELEALEEADFVLNIVRNKKVSLPIYIDIEDHDRQAKASKGDISKVVDAFSKAIRRNGYVAGVYSYPWFADKYLTKQVREENEFWIAEWTSDEKPKYNQSSYDSWQYSSKGGVAGYDYDIDKNVLYRDYPLIINGVSKVGFEEIARQVIDGKWGNGKRRRELLAYAGYDYDIIQIYVNKILKAGLI